MIKILLLLIPQLKWFKIKINTIYQYLEMNYVPGIIISLSVYLNYRFLKRKLIEENFNNSIGK